MDKKTFIALTLLISILILILLVFGSRNFGDINNEARARTLIEKAFPQYKIIKQFDTGMHLQAFILEDKESPDKQTITFTTQDGYAIVNGSILSWDPNENKLTDLSTLYLKYFVKDDKAAGLYLAIKQKANYIQQGSDDAPHKFYAVIDLHCEYCKALFIASQKAINANKLAVRWIIVNALGNEQDIANSIYNSKNPADALTNYELNGIYDKKNLTENPKLEENTPIKSYLSGYPTIIYKNIEGYPRISGGSKLPLAPAKIAIKDNTNKVNEFLLLTSNEF